MFSGGWRSDLPTALPIRKKRLEIFPRDIQKQVTEAKRMGTLPDLSAMLAAQLGLASGGGPSTAVPRAGEVPPSDAANTGKGRKRKRGNSGVEESAGEASGVPLSGDPQKKKKRRKKTKRSVEGDGAMNVVIDKYDTALKGVLTELELAKKEHAEKEEASARQLSTSKANVERLNGMVTRAMARRDELKADLAASHGGETPNRVTNAAEDGAPVLVLSDTSAEGSRRGNEEVARESSVRASELSTLNDRESDRED
ncbi:hypothetical protein IGI04_013821 [Brassica rapa subsp. trilocularis]|uniref:Uncharacterized protein n=1 Tax=Brassica rapa subsp. trilocularis TaxID=1813537 RepID=A0ABQ7N9Y2_BRACM|nr:hypothetical protein IGI04_013821 [Brassica rapa subsp. trilocularis]